MLLKVITVKNVWFVTNGFLIMGLKFNILFAVFLMLVLRYDWSNDKMTDDITFKVVVILMIFVIEDSNKFHLKLFLDHDKQTPCKPFSKEIKEEIMPAV